MDNKRRAPARKLSYELKISRTNIHRTLKGNLGFFPYNNIIQLFLTDAHKGVSNKFANRIGSNFREDRTMRILFAN